jgi:hypothetical protein
LILLVENSNSTAVLTAFYGHSFVNVRFEVSTAVTVMIIIFWEMTPCGSYKNRRFGDAVYNRAYCFALCLLVSFTLKMEAIRSSETSVLIRATRRHLPEDDNHHSFVNFWNIQFYKNVISPIVVTCRQMVMVKLLGKYLQLFVSI